MDYIHYIRAFFIFISVLLVSPSTRADWINLTGAETAPNIAEIYVLDNHVKLVLEAYIGDLKTFEELIPDEWLKDLDGQRPALAEQLRVFSSKKFQFVTETGEKLPAQLQLLEPRLRKDRKSPFAGMINPITRQRVPEAPSDKRVLYVELVYPFKEKPKELTIIPPLDEEGRALVTIGFIAYHKAVPIIDFRYLGAAAHVTLEWEDPWYTKFDNPNLKRHHKSALMSYLYVEPYEVRHEVLTRVKDLEQWIDLGLRGDEYIEPDELAPLRQRIGEFLLQKNAVRVDGKALKPILDRTNYVKVALTGIQLIENPERLEISSTIVGVIITYITQGLPQEVTVDWELFTDQIQRVPATAIDPAGPFISYVEPRDNVHTWTNFLKNYQLPTVEAVAVAGSLGRVNVPMGSLAFLATLLPVGWQIGRRRRHGKSVMVPIVATVALLGASLAAYPYAQISVAKPTAIAGNLEGEPAEILLHTLLKNVYRAFDFREEEDVYDKLALSVSGDLLASIYLQNRKSFAIQKAGGAQAKIKDVEILDVAAEKISERPLAFALKSKWTAMGTVGHWGHVHTRKNLYDAIVTVEAVEGNWKIMNLELLEEKRVDPYTQTKS
ncbi:MAG: hypothetical protein OES46_07785 [Gammaproteobacteria bacterium]|nr:hypothetical protein [Gammaproteobacteria bacterium]